MKQIHHPKRDKEFDKYFKGLCKSIATMIKTERMETLREQFDLAKGVGTTQPTISRMENPTYQGHTLKTLARVMWELGHKIHLDTHKRDMKAAK